MEVPATGEIAEPLLCRHHPTVMVRAPLPPPTGPLVSVTRVWGTRGGGKACEGRKTLLHRDLHSTVEHAPAPTPAHCHEAPEMAQ
jgi:hypothetical protein